MSKNYLAKIVPVRLPNSSRIFYMIHIPEQERLFNEKEASEFIEYLNKIIETVSEANKKERTK